MASATVLEYAQPAGLSGAYPPADFVPRQQLASSSSFVGSLIPPAQNAPSPKQHQAASTWEQPHNGYFVASAGAMDGALAAAKNPSDRSTLHKKAPRRSRKSDASRTPETISSRTFTPPVSQEPFPQASPRTYTNPISKDKVKSNLRRLATKEEDNTTLDLSLTAAENEQRSGLAIHSPSPTSPLTSGFDFSHGGRHRSHVRSYSATSQQSHVSGSFKPSAPFALSMQRSPRPNTPPQEYNAFAGSAVGSEVSSDALGILQPVESSKQSSAVEVSKAASRVSSRPTLNLSTSEISTAQMAAKSQSNLSYASSSFTTSRRNTTMSDGANNTPTSRTSTGTDRALRHANTSFRDSPTLDLDSRTASIHAARRAFVEKEEAKNKKHQERERKSTEKRARKMSKQHDGQRRKSDASEKTRSRASSKAQKPTKQTQGSNYADLAPAPETALPRRGDDPNVEWSPRQMAPRVSSKRAAKAGYVGLLGWLKLRFLSRGKKPRGAA